MSFMIVEHCIHLFSCNYHPLLNPNMYFTHTTSPTPTHSPPYIALSPPPWASPYKNIVWYSCGIPVVLHNTTENTTGIMKYHTKSCGTAEV